MSTPEIQIRQNEVAKTATQTEKPFTVYDHLGHKCGETDNMVTAMILHLGALRKDRIKKIWFDRYAGVCLNADWYGHPVFEGE